MLDTSVCVEVLRGRVVPARLPEVSECVVSVITAAELEVGVRRSARPADQRKAVQAFLDFFQVLPWDLEATSHYGEIRVDLETRGVVIGPLDMLIAANITAALLILMTAMFVNKPLDFSVFPAVILVATLFRLALNVSATRLVLLDGYAGTGAVGLEALSRGAAWVLFVERDRRAAALIRKNLAQCGVEERYTIESRDLAEVLRRLEPGVTFDFIFLDPPYDHPPTIAVLDEAGQRLGPDGILVLERATRRGFEVPADLDRVRDVKSGDSTLTFLARRPGAGAATEQR